tara:strand:- start:125 stop:358 length:234 start_codon:yes stop_codon:yes gene_type:complete
MKKQKVSLEKNEMANVKLHEFWSDDKNRKASVHKNNQGFYVKLSEGGFLREVRRLYSHGEQYAEDCAENFVLGLFDL